MTERFRLTKKQQRKVEKLTGAIGIRGIELPDVLLRIDRYAPVGVLNGKGEWIGEITLEDAFKL